MDAPVESGRVGLVLPDGISIATAHATVHQFGKVLLHSARKAVVELNCVGVKEKRKKKPGRRF